MINDAISKVLGPDQGGALGFGVTVKKFSQREHYTKLEEKYKKMEGEMSEMRSLMSQILKSQVWSTSVELTLVYVHVFYLFNLYTFFNSSFSG